MFAQATLKTTLMSETTDTEHHDARQRLDAKKGACSIHDDQLVDFHKPSGHFRV